MGDDDSGNALTRFVVRILAVGERSEVTLEELLPFKPSVLLFLLLRKGEWSLLNFGVDVGLGLLMLFSLFTCDSFVSFVSDSVSSDIENFLLNNGLFGHVHVWGGGLMEEQSLIPLSLRSLHMRTRLDFPLHSDCIATSSSFKLDIREAAPLDKLGRGLLEVELALEFRRLAAESVAIRPRARIAFPVF